VRETDNAIWNRLHPIPFDVTIPKAEQDKDLPAKLAAEAEGILAWAVAGAVQWYSEGLGKPTDVDQAGQAWRADSDQIGRFLDDCCTRDPNCRIQAKTLYNTYKQWCEDNGEKAATLSNTAFGRRMTEQQGIKRINTPGCRAYSGITIKNATAD
jgi:putative DNA primase/helicase